MKLQKDTRLYVVIQEKVSETTFGDLHNALNGGMKLEKIWVFTDKSEAKIQSLRHNMLFIER